MQVSGQLYLYERSPDTQRMRGWLKSTFGPDTLPQLDVEIQEYGAEILTPRLGVYEEK